MKLIRWVAFAMAVLVICMAAYAIYEGSRNAYEDVCNPGNYYGNEHCKKEYILPLAARNTFTIVREHGEEVVAIFTVLIALFTFGLFDSTEKMWKETRDAGDIAKTSADAAQKSANVAEASLIASNRPWLLTTVGVDAPFYVHDGKITIFADVDIENVGKSPAVDVAFHSILTTEEFLIPSIDIESLVKERLAIAPAGDNSFKANETVFVGQKIEKRRLTPECSFLADFDVTTNATWLLVGVTYRVPFGPDVIHHSGSLYLLHAVQVPQSGVPVPIASADKLVDMSTVRTYAD